MKTVYYGQTMEWTRISVFKKWINEVKKNKQPLHHLQEIGG